MLDRQLRKLVDAPLDRVAGLFVRAAVPADLVTVAGFLLGVAGCFAIASRHYLLGLSLILINRVADGLDGSIARRTTPTDRGGFLDITLDMIFYSTVPLAFGFADPENWPAASVLMLSFVGTGSSFLAYAVISAKRGQVEDESRKKSFVYSVGFMEGGETLLFFALFCMLPSQFPQLAFTFAGLCAVTVLIRLVLGYREFPLR